MSQLVSSYKPKLHDAVDVLPDRGFGVTLYHRASGRHYRVSCYASLLIDLLDGTHSLNDIQKRFSERIGRPVSLECIHEFITMLGSGGMLSDPPDYFGCFSEQQRARWSQWRHLRLSLIQGDRFLQPVAAYVRHLPTMPFRVLIPILLLNGLVAPLLLFLSGRLYLGFSWTTLSPLVLVPVGVLILLEVIIHEIAHGLCLTLQGGHVRDFGIGLHYFTIPYAYTNTTEVYRLDRRGRILVSLAGPMVDLILLGLNAVALMSLPLPPSIAHILTIWASFQMAVLIWNANPFLPFDGYYVLADLLNEPALRQKAFRYLWYLIIRPIRASHVAKQQYARDNRRLYLGYALLTLFYFLFFFGYSFLLVFLTVPEFIQ